MRVLVPSSDSIPMMPSMTMFINKCNGCCVFPEPRWLHEWRCFAGPEAVSPLCMVSWSVLLYTLARFHRSATSHALSLCVFMSLVLCRGLINHYRVERKCKLSELLTSYFKPIPVIYCWFFFWKLVFGVFSYYIQFSSCGQRSSFISAPSMLALWEQLKI